MKIPYQRRFWKGNPSINGEFPIATFDYRRVDGTLEWPKVKSAWRFQAFFPRSWTCIHPCSMLGRRDLMVRPPSALIRKSDRIWSGSFVRIPSDSSLVGKASDSCQGQVSFPFLWQHAWFQVLELLLDLSAPSKCHPRGNENPISTEVFNGKPIYQWGISHCHIWLPEGRIGHPLVPGNSEEKLPWLNWTDLMIALQARWTLQTLTVPWLHHCEIVTFAAIILIYIYIKYILIYINIY